jgi:dienelactone hydrolase
MSLALSASLPAAVAALLLGAFVLTTPVAAQTPAPTAAPVAVAAPAARAADVILREDGLVAEYFAAPPGAQASAGAVIVLGGSEGGLRGARGLARHLSRRRLRRHRRLLFRRAGPESHAERDPHRTGRPGPRLAQGPPRNPRPDRRHGRVQGRRVGPADRQPEPEIRAVVAGVPSHVVWAGIDQTGGAVGSSWTVDGRPLAYVPYDMSNGFSGVFNLYNDSLKSASAEAEIPVEAINGPVLMISGQADSLWPSSEMAGRVEQRLRTHGFRHPVINLAYPDAGHAVFGVPVAADAPGLERAIFLGGTVPGLVAARADGWPRVLRFLRDALNGG